MFNILVTIGLLVTSTFANESICPQNGNDYLPHPKNFGKFVRCVNGTATEMPCPEGLLYNSKNDFCYHPDDAKMGLKFKLKGKGRFFNCPGQPWCNDNYPVCPGSPGCPPYKPCSGYECPPPYPLPIIPTPNPCTGNQCNPPPCTGNGCSPPPNCQPGHNCPIPQPQPPICPGHPSCPTPQPQYPSCPGHPSCPTPQPQQPSCPGHPSCPPFPWIPQNQCPGYPGYPGYGHPVGTCPFCNDMCKVHMLPDANDCTVFYMCDWGCPIWKRCPPGLHFNVALQVCDYVWRAGCASNNQSCQ